MSSIDYQHGEKSSYRSRKCHFIRLSFIVYSPRFSAMNFEIYHVSVTSVLNLINNVVILSFSMFILRAYCLLYGVKNDLFSSFQFEGNGGKFSGGFDVNIFQMAHKTGIATLNFLCD